MSPLAVRLRSIFPHRRELGYWTLTFLVYLIAAKLGQFLYVDIGTALAFILPPTGIAIAALFLWGYRMWSAVALAAFVVSMSSSDAVPLVLFSTVGSALQALAGAFILKYFDFQSNISRLKDTLLLLVTALITSTIVPSISAVGRMLVNEAGATETELWKIVWSGSVLSILVLTPLITGFLHGNSITFTRRQALEHSSVFAFLIAVTYALFWSNITNVGGVPLIYLLLIPFFWIALRFSPRSTAFALFVTAGIAIGGVLVRSQTGTSMGQRLFQTELLLEIFAVIFLVISSAIEDRRTAIKELTKHVRTLEHTVTRISEQDTAKSDFLAILAHELRNPLAPVLNTLELLRMKRSPENEEVAHITNAESRLHTMSRLLDDILDIARVSEKRLSIKKETVQLSDIVARSIEAARPLMQKFNHELDVQLPESDIYIFADPMRIEQIIVNILNNAAKYTPAGGKIEFRASVSKTRVLMSIRDNGTGIEPTMLQKIFEPFLQVAPGGHGTGVGIGLSIAKELAQLHGGTITATSAGLGRGSTFIIELPLEKRMAGAIASEQTRAHVSEAVIRPLSVVVVDDNKAAAGALSRLLAFRGHKIALAFNGARGIEVATRENPDAILLDIGLPDIEGYDVAKKLREDGSSAFIVALSGYGQDDDRRRALESGCDAHLTKPVGLRDIESIFMSRFAV